MSSKNGKWVKCFWDFSSKDEILEQIACTVGWPWSDFLLFIVLRHAKSSDGLQVRLLEIFFNSTWKKFHWIKKSGKRNDWNNRKCSSLKRLKSIFLISPILTNSKLPKKFSSSIKSFPLAHNLPPEIDYFRFFASYQKLQITHTDSSRKVSAGSEGAFKESCDYFGMISCV